MPTMLVNPLDETPRARASIAPRLDSIRGKTIGLLDISKPGGKDFFDRLETLLKERGAAKVLRFAKPTFTKPAPDEVIDRIIKAQVQGVIEALAD
jgi:hypothetical protein